MNWIPGIERIREYREWKQKQKVGAAAIRPMLSLEIEYATFSEILTAVAQCPMIPIEWWGTVAVHIQHRAGRGKYGMNRTVTEIGRRFRCY